MHNRAAISAYRTIADKGQFLFRRALIIGPFTDAVFFFLSPLFALSIAFLVYRFTPLGTTRVVSSLFLTWDQLIVSVMNQAHLVLVLSRSHLNPSVFRRHPWRFTLIPLLAWVGMMSSTWIFIALTVIGILWGEYHSSVQTFGFARIYENRATGNPHVGRTADLLLCHAIYFVPIWLGDNLIRLVGPFEQFKSLDPTGLAIVPEWVIHHAATFRILAVVFGLAAVVYYGWVYGKAFGHGHPISVPKYLLLSSSLIVSALVWSSLPLLRAVFVIQFVHCWQYFAIVWWAERKNLTERSRSLFKRPTLSPYSVLFVGIVLLVGYGLFAIATKELPPKSAALSLVVVISLCHLWYDGFIWSVRKSDV